MKKKRIVLIVVILIFVVAFVLRRTPYTIAEALSEINLPRSLKVDKFQDEWNYNYTGDGETIIVFSFDKNDEQQLIKSCSKDKFEKLPISISLPYDVVYQFYNKKNQNGFYKCEIEKDGVSYKIAILDLTDKKLVIYNYMQ